MNPRRNRRRRRRGRGRDATVMKPALTKSPAALPGDGDVPLDSVLCTGELNRRPVRPPDYQTEIHMMVTMAQALTDSPETIMQKMTEIILETFRAGSSGFSLSSTDDEGKTVYWPAIAGAWKPHTGSRSLLDFSPCGDMLDRNTPLLFKHFERRYHYLLAMTPPAEEALYVPFYVNGIGLGAIWILAHDGRRKFDAEDQRQLISVAKFASAAYQVTEIHEKTIMMNEALIVGSVQQHTLVEEMEALNTVLQKEIVARQKVAQELEKKALQLADIAGQHAEKARLIDLSNDAIIVRDLDDKIRLWNKGAEKLFGWPHEEVIGKKFHSILDTKFPLPEEQITAKLHEEGQFNGEVMQIARDGRRVYSLCGWVLDRGTNSIFTSYTDITERKHAEAVAARLAAIVKSSEDAIIGKDLRGIITNWNHGAEQIFGYSTAEIIGQSIRLLIPLQRLEEEVKILAQIQRGESVQHFETVRLRKDGSPIDVSIAVSVIKDKKGRVIGASQVARDVTERKQAEAALKQAHAELESHMEELTRFNDMAVGRELRMIELKQEVNEFCRRQGGAARYPLDYEQEGKGADETG